MHGNQQNVCYSAVQPRVKRCGGFAPTDRSLTASKVLLSACELPQVSAASWRRILLAAVFLMHCRICAVELPLINQYLGKTRYFTFMYVLCIELLCTFRLLDEVCLCCQLVIGNNRCSRHIVCPDTIGMVQGSPESKVPTAAPTAAPGHEPSCRQ